MVPQLFEARSRFPGKHLLEPRASGNENRYLVLARALRGRRFRVASPIFQDEEVQQPGQRVVRWSKALDERSHGSGWLSSIHNETSRLVRIERAFHPRVQLSSRRFWGGTLSLLTVVPPARKRSI
jgi:hypothetical protein